MQSRFDAESADLIARLLEAAPNDTDLIGNLGSIFLTAGMIDKAEETFDRLAQIEPSRYDALLDIARAWVDRGEFDRAIGIVDRQIGAILARREKRKATSLLKAILKRDSSNVQALSRLAGIYKNVGERRKHVLSLSALAEAAIGQELYSDAIMALHQLIELEPDRRSYREQLEALLGDESSAEIKASIFEEAQDDGMEASIFDSYEAYSNVAFQEVVAKHPEFMRARLKLLEELVAQQPLYLDGHLKLKRYYIDLGETAKAAEQCREVARVYEQQGDDVAAAQFRHEADELERSGASEGVADADDGSNAELAPEVAIEDDEPVEAAPVASRLPLGELPKVDAFEACLGCEWRRASREHHPLSILSLALDGLDGEFTQSEPDDAMVVRRELIAEAIERTLVGAGQMLARSGRGGFLVLLPDTAPNGATRAAEAVRSAVAALGLRFGDGAPVTVSLGVATAFPHPTFSREALLASAAQAFERARDRGGNQIDVSPLLGG